MPQTGILNENGSLNVYIAKATSQGGTYTETFLFTRQYTRVEIEDEASKLFGVLHPTEGDPDIEIMEHEVLYKESISKSADHGQFVREIHSVLAAFRDAVNRRFGHENGAWHSTYNTKVSPAQNDLIELSRFLP